MIAIAVTLDMMEMAGSGLSMLDDFALILTTTAIDALSTVGLTLIAAQTFGHDNLLHIDILAILPRHNFSTTHHYYIPVLLTHNYTFDNTISKHVLHENVTRKIMFMMETTKF